MRNHMSSETERPPVFWGWKTKTERPPVFWGWKKWKTTVMRGKHYERLWSVLWDQSFMNCAVHTIITHNSMQMNTSHKAASLSASLLMIFWVVSASSGAGSHARKTILPTDHVVNAKLLHLILVTAVGLLLSLLCLFPLCDDVLEPEVQYWSKGSVTADKVIHCILHINPFTAMMSLENDQ